MNSLHSVARVHPPKPILVLTTPPPIVEQSVVVSVSPCVSVCLCVCLSAIVYSELHVRSSPNFVRITQRPWLGPPLAAFVLPVL